MYLHLFEKNFLHIICKIHWIFFFKNRPSIFKSINRVSLSFATGVSNFQPGLRLAQVSSGWSPAPRLRSSWGSSRDSRLRNCRGLGEICILETLSLYRGKMLGRRYGCWTDVSKVSGVSDFPGCDCAPYMEWVEKSEAFLDKLVPTCDAGELW